MISMIAAIGSGRELGRDGKLLFHLPEDMKYFKETTMGHPILMGRKTFESIGRALPGRKNYVVSAHPEGLPSSEVEVVSDLKGFLEKWQSAPEEIFVIGGGMVYFQALPYASKLYLTEVDADVLDADTWFPNFDATKYDKKIVKEGASDDLTYRFAVYTLK